MNETPRTMRCWIYRGGSRGDAYLYLARQDDFECVPPELRRALGKLVPVMELELHRERPLARAHAADVMAALDRNGYFLQLPAVDIAGRTRLQ